MTVNEKVEKLRKIMERENLDAYLINGTDPHNSEYVCPRWKTRAFISGFTGSAGTVLITKEKALLWVDSRYFIQGAKQIEGTVFTLVKSDVDNNPTVLEYLSTAMDKGSRLGISSDTLMIGEKKKMEEACSNLEIVPTKDFLNELWEDRPLVPEEPVVEMSENLTGFSRAQKLNMIRLYLGEKKSDYSFIASLDDIAWTLSLRGNDIDYNPLFLSYLLVTKEKAYLFTSKERFIPELLEKVGKDVEIYPYESAVEKMTEIIEAGKKVIINENKVNTLFEDVFSNCEILNELEVTTLLKACKNDTELEGMRRAHLLDGVAMVNFLSKIDFINGKYDEFELTELLEEQRRRSKECLGLSFNTISGFSENGAQCHYSVQKESAKQINKNGLLVLDSGGCYESGTTDITRTLLFGNATEEEKRDYTLVLKGHLALANQTFPQGTKGFQLDVLAKQFMWQYGMTFYHGTGHGVGHRLCVHEGPQNISSVPKEYELKKGVVISDEPGIYKEGRHGIRIENLLAVQEKGKTEFGTFMSFEVLTLCPYEKRLMDYSLLSDKEIEIINAYHQWVFNELKDLVDDVTYLTEATSPIKSK